MPGLALCVPSVEQQLDAGFFLFPCLPPHSPPRSPPLCLLHPIQVSTSPCATYGAWVGGSILCSLSTFKDMWVTSKECKDFGSSIVTRRNF